MQYCENLDLGEDWDIIYQCLPATSYIADPLRLIFFGGFRFNYGDSLIYLKSEQEVREGAAALETVPPEKFMKSPVYTIPL